VTSPAAGTATRSAAVRPLPVRPRPAAGDTPATYIRRLARANHLRPAYLNRYLRDDAAGQISIGMLAALAARPVSSLMHAFSQDGQVPPARRRYFTARNGENCSRPSATTPKPGTGRYGHWPTTTGSTGE